MIFPANFDYKKYLVLNPDLKFNNGTDINITANGGTVNGGNVTNSKIISSTIKNGGHGGSYNMKYMEGFYGPLISDLGIYVAGGGGSNAYYTNSGFLSYYTLNAGGASGGGGYDPDSSTFILNGILNTGGGAAGTTVAGTAAAGTLWTTLAVAVAAVQASWQALS